MRSNASPLFAQTGLTSTIFCPRKALSSGKVPTRFLQLSPSDRRAAPCRYREAVRLNQEMCRNNHLRYSRTHCSHGNRISRQLPHLMAPADGRNYRRSQFYLRQSYFRPPDLRLKVRGAFYAVEPNHGELDMITTSGQIRRIADCEAAMLRRAAADILRLLALAAETRFCFPLALAQRTLWAALMLARPLALILLRIRPGVARHREHSPTALLCPAQFSTARVCLCDAPRTRIVAEHLRDDLRRNRTNRRPLSEANLKSRQHS
jgi:hypothetical protein